MSLVTEKARFSYPHKGIADMSWPVCPNCAGHGQITQSLAIGGAKGIKGDTCAQCNGAGRVPDPSWPACACGGEPTCRVCGGLGQLSPEVQASLEARLRAARDRLDTARAEVQELAAVNSGLKASASTPKA